MPNGNPLHMDKPARNARVAEQLIAQGLYVEPVYRKKTEDTEKAPDEIDFLIVSAGLPDRIVQGQDHG